MEMNPSNPSDPKPFRENKESYLKRALADADDIAYKLRLASFSQEADATLGYLKDIEASVVKLSAHIADARKILL